MASNAKFLYFILLLAEQEISPVRPDLCPFNNRCECDETPDPLIFEMVRCGLSGIRPLNDKVSWPLPSFITPPDTKYTVTGLFRITANLTEIPANYFQAFDHINYLDLVNLYPGQQNWDDDAFEGVNITAIGISHVNGVISPPIALQKLGQQGLKRMYITYDYSITFENDAFKDFSSLDTLSIDNLYRDTQFQHAGDKVYWRYERLGDANPRGESPVIVGNNAFSGLESLQTLKIISVPLTRFPPVENLSKLHTLVLNDNVLDEIPSGIFKKLTHLTDISLDYNQLGKVALDFLPKKLWGLSLVGVGLTKMPALFKNGRRIRAVNFGELALQVNGQIGDSVNAHSDQNNYEIGLLVKNVEDLGDKAMITGKHTALTNLDLSVFEDLSECELTIEDDSSLRKLTVSDLGMVPPSMTISLRNTAIEIIDPKIHDLFTQDEQFSLDISGCLKLRCQDMKWMADQYVCQKHKQLIAEGARCADTNHERFGQYMERLFQKSNCTSSARAMRKSRN